MNKHKKLVFLFICIFILILPLINATWLNKDNPWSQYCKANDKSCEENEVFGNITNIDLKLNNYSTNFGSNFQPLVDDLDGDGNMEMLIWYGDNLSLFSYNFIYLDGTISMGTLVSNPAIVDYDALDDYKEVVAIVDFSGEIYYKVIQWDGIDFTEIQSIKLDDGYTYSGISCADFDGDGIEECFFRRSDGLTYGYDYLSSVNHLDIDIGVYANGSSSPNTFVPYVDDYDGDGDWDVFFAYDFVAVAIDSEKNQQAWYHRKLSDAYSPWWINATITDIKVSDLRNYGGTDKEVIIVGVARTGNTYPYNRYVWGGSISDGTCYASTTYCAGSCCCGGDYISLLGVYEKDSSVVWQKGFAMLTAGGTGNEEHEILSNIHLFDYSGPGSKEFGVKHISWQRGTYPHRCVGLYEKHYVFDGFDSVEVYCSDIVSGGIERGEQTDAMCGGWETIDQMSWADVDNDASHVKEWIGENKIITLDGQILFNFSDYWWRPESNPRPYAEQNKVFDNFIPIEVDGHLFLYATKPGKTIGLYSDKPSYLNDLSVGDISFFNAGGVVVSAVVHNEGDINQVEVEFVDSYQGETVKNETVVLDYIRSGSSATATLSWDLEEGHTVYVFVDPNDKIKETDEANNHASKEYIGFLNVYVEADVGLTKIDTEIENFIRDNLKFGFAVDDIDEADVLVSITKAGFATEEGWGYNGSISKNQDKTEDKPYGAVIGSLNKEGKHHIYVIGNDIDGFIAGSKELIKQEDRFIEHEDSFLIGGGNIDAIAVYDYLHTAGNLPYYKQDSDGFAVIVRKALVGRKYEAGEGNFTTILSGQNIHLRYNHLVPKNSQIFLEYQDPEGYPIVMGGGIWADISAWEELGAELSDEGKDVWLIEITGGPNMECDTCPNYTYDDLIDNVWPTYIEGVKSLSGKDKFNYVGHSNGGRVALDALSKGNINPIDIRTLILAGVPGNFSELSLFGEVIGSSGDYIISQLNNSNQNHVTVSRIGWLSGTFSGNVISLITFLAGIDTRISTNLFSKYVYWIGSDRDKQPGEDLTVDRFILIYGYNGFLFSEDNDYIVPTNDEVAIFKQLNAIGEKKLYPIFARHIGMCENMGVKEIVHENI